MLEDDPEIEIVGEAGDGNEAVEKAALLKPRIVVMDFALPSMNGAVATRLIRKASSEVEVLVLSMHSEPTYVRTCLEAGARGYLLKSDAGRDLVSAVDALRRNKTFFTPKVAQMVLEGYLGRPTKENEGEETNRKNGLRLTARQKQILQLLAEGKSSKEVAVALNISVKTAETHRANIMRRLDCHSVTELVRYAIRNHIIEA